MQSHPFKYYTRIAMIFVGLLLTANLIGEKPLVVGKFILPAGLLLFPITYVLGAILTEVYGFAAARQVIAGGMFCSLFMALMCRLAVFLPAAENWPHHAAYALILTRGSRLMVISVFSYFAGEFVNAYIIAGLKVKMQGRLFWLRALFGSWIGEGIETALFVPLAFYSTLSNGQILKLMAFYYLFKLIYGFCTLPLLSRFVRILKEKENVLPSPLNA